MLALARVLAPLLVPALQTGAQSPPPGPQEAADGPSPFLHYDYVEDGVLRGGRIALDPTDPLHVELGPITRAPASPWVTLVDNGPSANRIDLVFVGDGYTAGELGQYAADVDALWPAFLTEPPLATYASYFNVHRVDVTSLESGVDNDPQGVFRETALDMTFWCSGTARLLCVNVGKAQTKAASAPGRDCVLALANSTTYGGAGYDSLGTLSGRNGAALEIALHEFGHSFARLADEYEYGGPSTYNGPEPSEANVTVLTELELLALSHRWFRWLDLSHVGTFEGARYSRFGIYRPTFDSKMRSLGRPFEEVNSERFVRHVYRFVDPIDAATSPGRYPLDASFFVDPLDPLGHALDVQWSLDGVPIPGATAPTFDAATLGLVYGPHVLSVAVVDNTPLVRSPSIRTQHLTAERSWRLIGPRARPFAGPLGSAGPVLTLESTPGGAGPVVLRLESELEGVAVLFVSAEGAPHVHGGARVAQRFAAPVGPGADGRVSLALPMDAALLERTLHARAALVRFAGSRAGRVAWSNVVDILADG
jgi:hypothetical protein